MKFVPSLTLSASDLKAALQLWNASGDPRQPFAHILLSPLFASPTTLHIIRSELKEKCGSEVYFDSGGYYVQQGRLGYEELYGELMACYRRHQWADWYVLPDWVPVSGDDPQTVEHKVRATRTVAKLFYEELPDDLKRRVIPVVQGHNQMQVRDCVETYAQFARGTLGFGSFGTSGSSSGINTVTTRSVEVIRALIKLVKRYRFNIHLFGVGTPPLLYLFHQIGVASFDSMAWIKAAGYGNIFLPFMRGYLTTYRVATRKHIYRGRFEELKLLTGHRCAFCDDFSALVSKRMYRALHNLATVMDTVHILQSAQMDEEDILNIIALGSPTYLRYYKGV